MSYATEEGYAYLYISYENATAVDVYFDDVTMTYTPTRVIQYNEYYPFGLQTSNSWTRENSSNNFLYNEGSELNNTTGFYDLPFRNYDATLGRFFQIDPLAHVDHSTSPFAYAGNNPVMMNDPSGLSKIETGEIGKPLLAGMQGYQDSYWNNWYIDSGSSWGGGGTLSQMQQDILAVRQGTMSLNTFNKIYAQPVEFKIIGGQTTTVQIQTTERTGLGPNDIEGGIHLLTIKTPTVLVLLGVNEQTNGNGAQLLLMGVGGNFGNDTSGPTQKDISLVLNSWINFTSIATWSGMKELAKGGTTYMAAKSLAKKLSWAGLFVTGFDGASDFMNGKPISTSTKLDAFFGALAFVPGANIASGVYAGANFGWTIYTGGSSLGDSIDKNYYVVSTGVVGAGFILIPKFKDVK